MNTKEATCAERIGEQLEILEYEIADAQKQANDPNADDYFEGIIIYGIQRLEVIRLQLSGGGPADFVEITAREGEVIRVEYLFQDWYDSARLEVRESSPVYEWACHQYDYLREVGE